MKTADGSCHYSYKTQAVVDADHQVIIVTQLDNTAVDVQQLVPMLEHTRAGLGGRMPDPWGADAGYASNANLEHTRAL